MGLRSSISCYNNCCFCCIPLRTGCIILAILGCIAGGYQGVNAIQNLGDITSATGYVQVIINICYLVSAILLFVGAIKENGPLIIPYLVVVAIYIIVGIILAIVVFVGGGVVADKAITHAKSQPGWNNDANDDVTEGLAIAASVMAGILVTVALLNVHFWLVVYAYYEELRDGPVEDKDGRIPGRVMA